MSRSNSHGRGHRTPRELPVAEILGRRAQPERAAASRDLAARARELAGREPLGSAARAAALCAAVALAESSTITGARKILAAWDGPEHITTAAAQLVRQLAADIPAPGGAAHTE
jgi:hypothetical protein